MGVIFEIYPIVNAYELHVAGTLIPIEIPIVEIGGAPQMRGSGGCDSGFGQVLLRCLSKYVLCRVQPPIWSGAIEITIKTLNCTPARTMHSCEYFKPLSSDLAEGRLCGHGSSRRASVLCIDSVPSVGSDNDDCCTAPEPGVREGGPPGRCGTQRCLLRSGQQSRAVVIRGGDHNLSQSNRWCSSAAERA